MNYKYTVVLFFALILKSLMSGAQPTASKEKIEAIKIGFLTERLDLTSSQAAGFWPIYNEYSSKRKELKLKLGALQIEKQIDQLTEEEITSDLKTLFTYREAELQLEKEYMTKFTKYISQRQVAKLYYAEREFVKLLLKKLESK